MYQNVGQKYLIDFNYLSVKNQLFYYLKFYLFIKKVYMIQIKHTLDVKYYIT